MYGKTDFNITLKVTELNFVGTNGLITARIPKDIRWKLDGPFNLRLIMLGSASLNNSVWSYSENANYHIFTTTSVIPAGGYSIFGFRSKWDAGQTIWYLHPYLTN